jgi:outer membrane protein assembly factor BamB
MIRTPTGRRTDAMDGTRRRKTMRNRGIVFAALALVLGMFSPVRAAVTAEKLLEASGVRGGIVVVLGCEDAELPAALHANDRYLVHALDTDSDNVAKARTHIDSLRLYGKVSAETYDGKNLPYGDNVVNLLVLPNADCRLPNGELERVLAPRGVVIGPEGTPCIPHPASRIDGGYAVFRKPVPSDIDDWTHFLYDAGGNAVCKDKRVRRPRHVQWYAGPKRSRHHDALASLSAMTSSGGRLFYIYDEGPTSIMHRPPKWRLIARDAFNGKLLWKREIPTWMTHLFNFRGGPKQLPRRLVSVGEHVYATLGLSAPVEKLDGATGKTLMTFAGSAKTEEIVHHDGKLLAVIGNPDILIEKSDGCVGYWEMAEFEDPTVDKSIVAYDADTGKTLWTVKGDDLRHIVPLSLCALNDNVFYLDNEELHCIAAGTGKPRWAAPFKTKGLFMRAYAPTVVAHDDVIMCLKWNRMAAFSVASGKTLWDKNKGAVGFGSPADLLAIGDKAWVFPMTKSIWRDSKRTQDGIVTTGINIPKTNFFNEAKTGVGIDIHSGEVTDLIPFAHTQHHHRCYRNKATEQYVLLGHSGIQVVDLATKGNETHRWVRGLCQYGIMPANGYIYVPPDTCRCYNSGKINGLFALSEKNSWEDIKLEPALEEGPAYAKASAGGPASGSPIPQSAIRSPQSASASAKATADKSDWPTYRGNNARGGTADCAIPVEPAIKWRAEVGPTLTAPVIASGKVFVADRDAYTVQCLDAKDGNALWKYLANGPVDSPPTIQGGLCVFGCGDGSVYCLDVASGRLAWRFKTSRIERRIGHEDRLESPLRIHGSVLVQADKAYFAAGYSSNLDGGIRLYGVNVRTGELLHRSMVASGHWGKDGQWGHLGDILVSDGTTISMRGVGFDATLKKAGGRGLLASSTGLLEGSWFHRQGWSGGGGKGQLIVFDENRSVSVTSPYTDLKRQRKSQFRQFNQVGHFHQKFTRYEEDFFPVGTTMVARDKRRAKAKGKGKDKLTPGWTKNLALQPRAMVAANDRLCVAGWMDSVVIEMKSGRATNASDPDPRNSVLRVYSATDGKPISELKLDTEPVFDGMAAADGKVYLSLKDGTLLCLGE